MLEKENTAYEKQLETPVQVLREAVQLTVPQLVDADHDDQPGQLLAGRGRGSEGRGEEEGQQQAAAAAGQRSATVGPCLASGLVAAGFALGCAASRAGWVAT